MLCDRSRSGGRVLRRHGLFIGAPEIAGFIGQAVQGFAELGKLGLAPSRTQESGVREYRSGSSKVLVYESQFAGTNKATAATWMVDDVTAVVKALKAKGVAFEHYDLPGVTREGDVHLTGRSKAAWFKDPDGNILALGELT